MKSDYWFHIVIGLMCIGLTFFISDWIIPVLGFLIGVILYTSSKTTQDKSQSRDILWIAFGTLLMFYFAMGYALFNGEPIRDPGLLAMIGMIGSTFLLSIIFFEKFTPKINPGTIIISGGILLFALTLRGNVATWILPAVGTGACLMAIFSTFTRYLPRMFSALWVSGTMIASTIILSGLQPLTSVLDSFISGEHSALSFMTASSAGFIAMYVMPLYILGIGALLLGAKKLSKQHLEMFEKTLHKVVMRRDKNKKAQWLQGGNGLLFIAVLLISVSFTTSPPLIILGVILMGYNLTNAYINKCIEQQ